MVGGVALLIALAGIIDRAGIGYGVLLLFLAPTLVELPLNLAFIADAYGAGTYPLSSIVLAGLFTALSVAAIVGLLLAARGAESVAAACVWPLLIAYTLLAWVLFGIGMAVTGGDMDQAAAFLAPGSGVRYVALAAIIILTVWLYVRSGRIAGLPSPVPAAPIAAALVAIALAAELLQSQLQTALPLGAVHVVVAAVVATGILLRLSPAGSDAEGAAQSSGLNR